MLKRVASINPDRDTLGLDFDNQATDFSKPPYSALNIENSYTKRSNGPQIEYRTRQSHQIQIQENSYHPQVSKPQLVTGQSSTNRYQSVDPEENNLHKQSHAATNYHFPASYTNTVQLPVARGFSFGDQAPTLNHYLTYSSYPQSSALKQEFSRPNEKSSSFVNISNFG